MVGERGSWGVSLYVAIESEVGTGLVDVEEESEGLRITPLLISTLIALSA